MEDRLYKFAVYSADNMECEIIAYPVPDDEPDPKAYFEAKTGERVHACWESDRRMTDEVIRNK